MAACVLIPHQTPSPENPNKQPDFAAAGRAITNHKFAPRSDFYSMPEPMLAVNTRSYYGHNHGGFLHNSMGSMQYPPKQLIQPTLRQSALLGNSDWSQQSNPACQIIDPLEQMAISEDSFPVSKSLPLSPQPSYGPQSVVAAGSGPSLTEHSRRMNSWPTSQTSPPPIGTKERRPPVVSDEFEEVDSDEEDDPLHPNKFPTVLEHHTRKECGYRRQATRSGPKMKQVSEKIYNAYTGQHEIRQRVIKYYEKDLVRYCICGKYEDKSSLLTQGRSNDCKGYEIHYSQKCKWKGYTDFHTKETVIIRLCKCYKPT